MHVEARRGMHRQACMGVRMPAPDSTLASPRLCSACRMVWYCNMECCRANWRNGGHRHVCTALKEARQAAKEARRAARAAAAAAEAASQ